VYIYIHIYIYIAIYIYICIIYPPAVGIVDTVDVSEEEARGPRDEDIFE